MNDLTNSPLQIVLGFIACFNEGKIADAIAMLDDRVFYHNIPMEPMTGRDAVASFTYGFGIGTHFRTEWTITNIAACDNVVLTERVDAFITEDGRRFEAPVMGSFKIENGCITEWRDYFDLADFENKLASLELSRERAASKADEESPHSPVPHKWRWPDWEMGCGDNRP